MQSSSVNSQPSILSTPLVDTGSSFDENAKVSSEQRFEGNCFEGHFSGQMDMMADAATVARYLDAHSGWFQRCAHPMHVEAITENGYALVVGHFGALGYEIEPQIGLHLLPQADGIYRIETIAVPGYTPQGYDVDFRAALCLSETQPSSDAAGPITQVEWELHLTVEVQFPRFIKALPQSLVKGSGDQLLNQVVRQVSKRLTHKVQEDFHATLQIPLPQGYQRHHFWSNWGKRSD